MLGEQLSYSKLMKRDNIFVGGDCNLLRICFYSVLDLAAGEHRIVLCSAGRNLAAGTSLMSLMIIAPMDRSPEGSVVVDLAETARHKAAADVGSK